MIKAIERANKFVGTRCKIYYPWKSKMIYRVVMRDSEGYYVKYEGEKRRLRVSTNDFGEFTGFEMLHGR